MKHYFQLFIFNAVIGNPTGFKLIIKHFGWLKGISIVLKMQSKMIFDNPFRSLNSNSAISANKSHRLKQKLSQKQILPAFALYDTLISKGYDIDESVKAVESIVIGVAREFLKFTVPVIQRQDIDNNNSVQRTSMFKAIVARFPNAFGRLTVADDETYHFTVDTCLFASYCSSLGYDNLAAIFCKADQIYFDQHQPNIQFTRTDSLAMTGRPCDFSFALSANIIAKG